MKSEMRIIGGRPIGLTTFDGMTNRLGKRKHEEYLRNYKKRKWDI